MAGAAGGGGSSSSSVSVLAPNGRRVTVRVGPSTALLQILEEVCKKQDFSPSEYDLKFQRTVLDLSLQWRFANLPNNAKLEMVPVSRNRAGTETAVRIALQLDDGSRLQDIFSSSQTLWYILHHFPQTREYVEHHCEISPVCIYMRDEVTGTTALEKTSLKSLGLTGGSAIIRVVTKKTATSSGHAETGNIEHLSKELEGSTSSREEPVGAPVPHSLVFSTSSGCSDDPALTKKCTDNQDWNKEPQDSSVACHLSSEPVPSPFVPFVGDGQRLGGGGSPVTISPASDVPLSNLPTSLSSPGGPSKPKKSKNSQEKLKEEECLDREPIVCHLDLQQPLDSVAQDLPDEFFEVTVDDVRKRLAQLQNERKRLEEAPLMTQAQREAQMKEKLERYPKVVLRIYFPDRHILQGFFHPSETVGALRVFVKSHLEDPEIPFYLFITPPRSILTDDSLTLFQANLIPAAIVYFGSEKQNKYFLRLDLLESAVSPSEADILVARRLSKSTAHAAAPSSQPAFHSPPEPNEAGESVVSGHSETATVLEAPQPQTRKPPSGKVPKWLKLPGGKR